MSLIISPDFTATGILNINDATFDSPGTSNQYNLYLIGNRATLSNIIGAINFQNDTSGTPVTQATLTCTGQGLISVSKSFSVGESLDVSPGTAASTITLGSTTGTGDISVGISTAAQTVNIGTGAAAASTTKTINIGTAGVSTSTTNINIGSATSNTTTDVYGILEVLAAQTGGAASNGLIKIHGKDFGTVPATITQGAFSLAPWLLINSGTDANSFVSIQSANSAYTWTFNNAGVLSAPGNITTTGQLISTLAAGTAPLSVISNTVVPNLNASLLSGSAVGTSGATIPLCNGTNTFSGDTTFSGTTVTVGTSTAASTYGLGTGATINGATKAINIGTNGVAGSTTTITIGSTNGTTTTINGTVNASISGSAATWTTGRTISLTGNVTGTSGTFNGSANLSFATTIAANAVTLAMMADVATGTVFYRKTAATGDPEVQTLATLKTDLGLTGTNSGDQTITLTGNVTGSGTGSFATTIASNVVTNAMLSTVSTGTIKGRATAATGNVEDLTGTQVTALLDAFTSTLKGLAPASGGGTTNFLRADGTWASPASGSFLSASTTSTQDGYFTGINLLEGGTTPTFYTRIINGTDLTATTTLTLAGLGTADRTITFPGGNASITLASIGNISQTFQGTTTFSNATVTIGSSTAASTYGLGTGATIAAATKAINIGTNGVSTSITNIEIGSATSTTTVNTYGDFNIKADLDGAGAGNNAVLRLFGKDFPTESAFISQTTFISIPWLIINSGTNTSSFVSIQTNNSTNTWTFGNNGELALPLDAAVIKTGTSGTSNLSIKTANSAYTWTFNNDGNLHLSNALRFSNIATPSTPSAGTGLLYSKDIAGRTMPEWIGPSGIDYPLQPHIGFNNTRTWRGGATTTATTFAATIGAMPYTGASPTAPTIPALASTNLLTQTYRSTISTGATAGGLAYIRGNQLTMWRGNAAGIGGFLVVHRFALSGTLQTGIRVFAGIVDVAANPTNIDPLTTTAPGGVGLAINANTGNWSIVNNITGTARTATGLGASFPVNNTSLMELVLFCAPNGASIGYRVSNLSTGASTSGTLSTNIPASTTFLAPVIWVTNNATAAAQTLDFISTYVETDY